MKKRISGIVLIASLSAITACDQVYDSVISFADLSVEEALEDVSDEDLAVACSNEDYLATLKISKEECTKKILSKKEVCLKSAQHKWENKISTKEALEQMASEYVECLMK